MIATGLEDQNQAEKKTQPARRNAPDYRFPKEETRPEGGFSFQRSSRESTQTAKTPSTPSSRLRAPETKGTERDIQIPDFLRRN